MSLSDVLADAVSEIDEHLADESWPEPYATAIQRVRNEMDELSGTIFHAKLPQDGWFKLSESVSE